MTMLYLMAPVEDEEKESEFYGFVKTIKKAMKREVRLLRDDIKQSLKSETVLVKSKVDDMNKEMKTQINNMKSEIGQVKTEIGQVKTEIGQVKTKIEQ